MISKEHPGKKTRRLLQEAKQSANKKLDKNPNKEWVKTNLKGKRIKYKGITNPDPELNWRLPLTNGYVEALPMRTRNRTGATHFVIFHNILGASEKIHGLRTKVNLSDFPIQIQNDEPITYKGKKYLLVSLDDSLWQAVLFPAHTDMFYEERP